MLISFSRSLSPIQQHIYHRHMTRHRTSEKRRPVEDGVPSCSTSGQSDTETEILANKPHAVLATIPAALFSQLHTVLGLGKYGTPMLI